MSNVYYIAELEDDEHCGSYMPTTFYTKNEELLKQFIIQSKDQKFDIRLIKGDNIIEVADDYNKTKISNHNSHHVLEYGDLLQLYISKNIPDISFISTDNCIEWNAEQIYYIEESLLRILVSSIMNLNVLLPYIRDNDTLNCFLQFISIYIKRLAVIFTCDVFDLSTSQLNELKLTKYDTYSDVIDETLIHYMCEFGWGDSI